MLAPFTGPRSAGGDVSSRRAGGTDLHGGPRSAKPEIGTSVDQLLPVSGPEYEVSALVRAKVKSTVPHHTASFIMFAK